MKKQYLLSAMAMGLGLAVVLLVTLAHSTTVVRADPGIYYVREGAAGDCLYTTTPCGSVQQAIDMAALPGDEVWVTTGTFTENLGITHSVELRGGWNVSFTVQNPTSTPTVLDGDGEHNVRVEDTPQGAQITIEGLTLRNGQDGVHIWDGNVTVERCTILNVNKQGFEIDGGTVSISATQIMTAQQGIEVDDGTVQAANVHIAHTDEEGVLIEGGGAVTLTGSTIEDCTQQGIQIDQGSVWLFDNYIHDVISDAIHINGGSVSVVSNTIHAIQSDGIDASGSQVISGNLVYDTVNRGIYARDGGFEILDNTVRDTDRDAIRVANGMVVLVQGNVITNAGNDGIDARGMFVLVADNRIYGAWDRGINAEDGALTIVDNAVYDSGGDGIRTAGSSTGVEIRSNAVHNAGNDGIDARGDAIAISHNTVSDCADNGVRSEGDVSARIEVNRILDNGIGLAIRGAPVFTITNNVIGDHVTASVELTGTGSGVLYHNTLVGSGTGVRGTGLAVLDPLAVTLVNNIVVSHNVGISATAGATLIAHNTLLWANGDDPVGGSAMIPAPPLFVDPAQQDYHLRRGSPAIEAGIAGTGVTSDMDGEPRPIGPLPDVGADEFPAGLNLVKWADPVVVQPGAPLTYTIRVTNTGLVTLTTTLTDTLPDHVSAVGTLVLPATFTWTRTLTPAAVWTETVVVTVEAGYVGPLINVVRAVTDEGAAGIYTHTLAPDLAVTKRATPSSVAAGERLTYTIYVTNTGNFHLNAIITDTLPMFITSAQIPGGTILLPGEQIVWTASIPAPGGVWTETVVVTAAADYVGPLTNVVQVTTDKGATGIYVETSNVFEGSIYLPLVMRNYVFIGELLNPGFEGITCHPDSPPEWCWGNWTHDTHDGEYHDNIFTPQGWVTWWSKEAGYGQPEVKTIPNVPPFNGELPRIRSGNYATQLFTFYRAHDAGLYQVVTNLPAGTTIWFWVYAHGWSCNEDDPLGYSCGDPWAQTFRVGIEPNGVADPFSSSIIWSAAQASPDHYAPIGPVTAEVGPDNKVCVYVRSIARWAVKHNDAYWDDAKLVLELPRS